jgi:hypothetical protein
MGVMLDNDVLHRLAVFDLWGEFLDLIDHQPCYVHRLYASLFVLCPPDDPAKALRLCGDEATINRLRAIYQATNSIPSPENLEALQRLVKVSNLDPGEGLIFAVLAERLDWSAYFNDRRAMIAFGTHPSIVDLRDSCIGRVHCFHELIAQLCNMHGTAFIAAKIRTRLALDNAWRSICGSGPSRPNDEQQLMDGIASYYRCLDGETGGILAPFPPG